MASEHLALLRKHVFPPQGASKAFEDLWRGDVSTLGSLLARPPAWEEGAWSTIRYEVSLIAGTAVGTLITREDRPEGPDRRERGLYYRRLILNGGGPIFVDNADALAEALLAALRPPPSLASHRLRLLESLTIARDASTAKGDGWLDHVVVARHHTQLPIDFIDLWEWEKAGRTEPGCDEPSPITNPWRSIAHLLEIAQDPLRFDAHVVAGLDSRSVARRCLSVRLLAREGRLDLG